MLLQISDNKTISMVQRDFSGYFPFLKIEFFDEPHKKMEGSKEIHRLREEELIGHIRQRHNTGMLEIHPLHTPYYIEKQLKNRYGLYVQVYRIGPDGWIQTAGSDLVTLGEQNEIARQEVESRHLETEVDFTDNEY
ncbi:MAG TPA: hypothetical protein VFS25_25195 [Chitinophaga sp.]|uniref:hypothetical protein n=1 Tax=Chitinophaga sp. TaxID=1869181 RepID=UPI002DC010A9|nr:hypothetical protein [Chitinophaga sp.]HEU4556168.1 hypothetical protein [Chitinophaga sp.]